MSYLLRIWQTRDGEELIWRASLESPGAGGQRGFASLKDLFEFLETQTSEHQRTGLFTPTRTLGGESALKTQK